MYNFVLGCGPTGGHLIPALLVAEEIENRGHGVVLYSSVPPSNKLLEEFEIDYQRVNMDPWQGAAVTRLIVLAKTAFQTIRLRSSLSEFDAAIGFGGYSTVPVLLGAFTRKIPVFIQEQNRIMGRANRLFGRLARWCFYGLPPLENRFDEKSSLTGTPVRRGAPVEDPWFVDHPLLLVIGGSQGALEISNYLRSSLPHFLRAGWHVYYLRGDFGRDLKEFGREENFRQVKFDPRLHRCLAVADCAWARAGAGTLAELIHYGVPALLFPYQKAAEDHQLLNARWLLEHGPARLSTPEMSAERRFDMTGRLADSNDKYSLCRVAGRPAEKIIVDKICDILE